MEKNRLVTELFFEKPNFKEVSNVGKSLEDAGVKMIILPPEDREMNTHLIVETADLEKIRSVLEKLNVKVREKEVILIELENHPGTMAAATKKISDKGINLKYVFSVFINPEISYALFGTENNTAALEALQS